MGLAAVRKMIKARVRPQMEEQDGWFAAWFVRLKAQIAEIAATKSSQQFGREEETK